MKPLNEYPTPETDEAIRASESMPTFQMEIISLRSDLRNMERRLAACRESLQYIRDTAMDKTIEVHPDDDAKGCIDEMLECAEQTLTATAKP